MKDRTPKPEKTGRAKTGTDLALSLSALGIVYGDIGTSPLYAFRESFLGGPVLQASADHVLGVLSMIVWSLILVISVKYLQVVMRADNHGEGGLIALVSLLDPRSAKTGTWRWFLVVLGLFGAALLFGDGTITPAISVLSALEGLVVATPGLEPFIVPLAILVLIGLFALQRQGTDAIGRLFGPVMVVWFLVLAILGVISIVQQPHVLTAIDPMWAVRFVLLEPVSAFFVLGAVFLAVTGGETLYADMGHFGARPIRLAWFGLVFPAIVLNYFGQGALVLSDRQEITHPFFHLAPDWATYPLVGLATAATIIASQAVISGVFSLTRQAINLGQLPALRILQTSDDEYGQIYIPSVNWMLFFATVGLVIGFGSSENLASAYGLAISTDMIITTVLVLTLATHWRWNRFLIAGLSILLLPLDFAFFASSLTKILSGGWYPILAGVVIFALMAIWRDGRSAQFQAIAEKRPREHALPDLLATKGLHRSKGVAVFVVSHYKGYLPAALTHMVERLHSVPETIIFAQVVSEDVPHVASQNRLVIHEIHDNVYELEVHYGFQDNMRLPIAVRSVGRRLDFDPEKVTYIVSKDVVIPSRKRPVLKAMRDAVYRFMNRNANRETAHFGLPLDQTIEISLRIEL